MYDEMIAQQEKPHNIVSDGHGSLVFVPAFEGFEYQDVR
jgi:hypothetical protein